MSFFIICIYISVHIFSASYTKSKEKCHQETMATIFVWLIGGVYTVDSLAEENSEHTGNGLKILFMCSRQAIFHSSWVEESLSNLGMSSKQQ